MGERDGISAQKREKGYPYRFTSESDERERESDERGGRASVLGKPAQPLTIFVPPGETLVRAGGDVPPLETLMSRLQGVPQGKVFPFKKHTCKTKKAYN